MTIYDARSRREAELLYGAWWHTLSPTVAPFFRDVVTAVGNWHEPIFAYFDHRFTNAVTEALNGLVKLAQRRGRGYSFEVIRAKILFTPHRHVWRRSQFEPISFRDNLAGFIVQSVSQSTNCGTDLSILLDDLNHGRF